MVPVWAAVWSGHLAAVIGRLLDDPPVRVEHEPHEQLGGHRRARSRLRDSARSYSSDSTTNGRPSVAFSVSQTSGSNAREIIQESKAILDEASKTFPQGVRHVNLVDANELLSASISKVVATLVEAFGLVFLVVFVFLQDFRSTLIPAIAVPVAIIGTFALLLLFGFTINLLTLFALVLAIGIVVDDARAVLEGE